MSTISESIAAPKAKKKYYEGVQELLEMSRNLHDRAQEMGAWFDNIPELIVISDRHNLLYINKNWERILGYSSSEILSMQWITLTHPHDVQATIEATSINNGDFCIMNRFRNQNGEYIWFDWHGNVVNNGERIYCSGRPINEKMLKRNMLDNLAKEREVNFSMAGQSNENK